MPNPSQPSTSRPSPCAHATRARLRTVLSAAALLAPGAAHAQTFRKILRGLEKAAAGADTAAAARGAAGTASAAASGGALRIVEQRLEPAPGGAVRSAPDTGTTVLAPAAPCGPQRACAAGWDLRVVSVTLPGPEVPAGAPFVARVEVENRGRVAAPASEATLCLTRYTSEACAKPETVVAIVPLPTLGPGERAVIRRTAEVPERALETQGWIVVAEVDREGATPEASRANNVGRSAAVAARLPALQFHTVELPEAPRVSAALPVTLRLRNTSAVAASRPTDLQLAGYVECGLSSAAWGGGPNRVAVPAIGPGASFLLRVVAPDAAGRCSAQYPPRRATLKLAVDPDHRQHWSSGHEGQIERAYDLR